MLTLLCQLKIERNGIIELLSINSNLTIKEDLRNKLIVLNFFIQA